MSHERQSPAAVVAAAGELFHARISMWLQELGALITQRDLQIPRTELVLNTPVGLLRITVYDRTIYSCFDDAKAGYEFTLACCWSVSNPHSGKWNMFFGSKSVASLRYAMGENSYIRFIQLLLRYDPIAKKVRSHEQKSSDVVPSKITCKSSSSRQS